MNANNQNNYINEAEIRKTLQVLKPSGQLFEIRVIDTASRRILSGYFDNVDVCIKSLSHTELKGKNVHFTLQRVKSDCKSRSQYNKIMFSKVTTSDKEIEAYDWLFVDVDPERTSGTSSTDVELQSAYQTAKRVQEYLAGRGFKEPVKAISGNGAHLLYKIDLENTNQNQNIVEKCLKVISLYMSDDKCKVDTANSNPGRVCKLYGTLAQKGTSTPERPHRLSRIVSVPENIECTPLSVLQKLAKELPDETRNYSNSSRKYSDFDIESWMHEHGLNYNSKAYGETMMYILDECPFDSNHKAPDAKIFQYSNGKIGFKCWHNSCSDKHWKDVRRLLEPDAYNRTASGSSQESDRRPPRDNSSAGPAPSVDSDPIRPNYEDVRSRRKLLSTIQRIDPFNKAEYRDCTDLSNGKLFADVYYSKCRYNTTAKAWAVYDGRRWLKDQDNKVVEGYAKDLVWALGKYAADVGDKYYSRGIASLNGIIKRNNMVRDAASYYKIRTEVFDKDPYLLNCQNGVLNLRTFEFMPHDPDLMLSKIAGVSYDPTARAELFESCVEDYMQNDHDLVVYLQQVLGYALLGEDVQEKCYFFYGPTSRNGKSTLIETIGTLLTEGEYAACIQAETLARSFRNGSSHSEDVARLAGARFVHANEPAKDMKLDASRLKQFTGRDSVTTRKIFEGSFEFKPAFTLFIACNSRPVIDDDSLFTSGRINVIPFNRHFSEDEQDKRLKAKLLSPESLSGILNWLLDGLRLLYQRDERLIIPEAVKEATADYRAQNDKTMLFFRNCMTYERGGMVDAQTVFATYKEWCANDGLMGMGRNEFYNDLRNKSLLVDHITIAGKTVRNMVINHKLKAETMQ